MSKLEDVLGKLSKADQQRVLVQVLEYKKALDREKCHKSFMTYVKKMWPGFILGRHHGLIARKFEEIAEGKLKRLIINLPPRHTKSEFASYLLPSWFLGKFPGKKVIQSSNTADLAVSFGRKVRNLVSNDYYGDVFPNVSLRQDSKAAGRWATNHNGEYFAIGVGGTVTGKGADLLIIDDPHSEQEAIQGDPTVFDKVFEWYTSGVRQRLQPGASIVIVMTRWAEKDLTGRLMKEALKREKREEWELIELPAILPSGNPLWPEFWSIEELQALKEELPVSKWNAQYQQTPTGEEGAIIKREWWQSWDDEEPPKCEFIIQSWDTAFTKNERSDYSACTTWGVFYKDEDKKDPHIILLDAFQKRMEFPELKDKALEHYKEWEPDACIIEAKAAGAPLVYELRKIGVPVFRIYPRERERQVCPNQLRVRPLPIR